MEILRYFPAKEEGALQGTINMRMKVKYESFDGTWIQDVETKNDIKVYKNKHGKRFISLPSKVHEKDGEKKYFPYNKFDGKEQFENALLKCLDLFLAKTQDAQQEDVPF